MIIYLNKQVIYHVKTALENLQRKKDCWSHSQIRFRGEII